MMTAELIKEYAPAFMLGALVSGGGWAVSHEFGTGGKVDALITIVADTRADVRDDMRDLREGLRALSATVETLRVAIVAESVSSEQARDELAPKLLDIEQRLRELERTR